MEVERVLEGEWILILDIRWAGDYSVLTLQTPQATVHSSLVADA